MNPYYKAWLNITGGGELCDFMSWIHSKHVDFKKNHGGSAIYKQEEYIIRFTQWLESQCFVLESV